ncbi:MAG TPA: hypothetical protein VJ276_22340, partial [Thermoanaerobaculia bacterium]|nr:hypothetical protein [Thermoanaerobaculia bacterium]
MKSESCQRYLEDPEANASHPETCAECAFFAEIGADVARRPVKIETLPLAPWEGARHRSWPLVLGGALAVLAIAAAVFSAAGMTPMQVLRRLLPNLDLIMSTVRLLGDGVQHAPAGLQIAIGVSFLVVNT